MEATGVAVVTGAPAGLSGGDLRTLALDIRGRLADRPVVVLLASESDGKVALVAALNPAALDGDVVTDTYVPNAGQDVFFRELLDVFQGNFLPGPTEFVITV